MDGQAAIDKVNELSARLDTAVTILAKVREESKGSMQAIADLKVALEEAMQNGGQVPQGLVDAIETAAGKAESVVLAAQGADDEVPDLAGDQ